MAYLKSDEVEGFRRLARCIYLSKEVVEDFIDNATPGQMRAVTGLIEDELEVRERHKRERFMHKARFPVIKSFDG